MKTDFSINVQVNLGVTPEIVALVNAILCHRPTVAPTAEEALNGNEQVDNKPEDTTPAQSQQPTNKRGRKKKEEAAADKPEPTKEPAGDEQQEAAANEADANGEQVAKQEEAQAEEAASQNEGQAKAQAEAEAEAEQKPLTAEDVRAAMHKTRQRIEGEDYKENTNGEAYKKYHKPLTAQFKNIAALLGAEKPSALPPDKIADFIEQCNGLQIMEDGTIGSNCPF
jgi:type IV secretory pathway VirB10-like protein